MSPHIMIDLEELHKGLLALNREFHFNRHNNRPLVSRNKREGWYLFKLKGGLTPARRKFVRTHVKDNALRYRKQSGVQFFRPTLRYKSK